MFADDFFHSEVFKVPYQTCPAKFMVAVSSRSPTLSLDWHHVIKRIDQSIKLKAGPVVGVFGEEMFNATRSLPPFFSLSTHHLHVSVFLTLSRGEMN